MQERVQENTSGNLSAQAKTPQIPFIQIPRSLLQHPGFLDAPIAQQMVLIHLIAKAAFLPCIQCDHGHLIELQIAQVMFSRRSFAKSINAHEMDVRRAIERFEKYQILTHTVTHRKSIVTITHSDTYALFKRYADPTADPKVTQVRPKSDPQKDKEDTDDKVIKIDDTIVSSCSEPAKRRSKPKDVLSFDFEKSEYVGITQKDIDLWQKAYPGIDLPVEIAKSANWIVSNRQKTSNRTQWRRYLSNWFNKAADRALTQATYKAQSPRMSNREKVMARFKHGSQYNGAICYFDEKAIGFQRGMTHHSVKFEDQGFDSQLDGILRKFGIAANG